MAKPIPTTTEDHINALYSQLRVLAGHTHPGIVSDGGEPPEVIDWSEAIDLLDEQKVDKGALVFNVKDYGALGNGIADDTAAILAAQTAAGTRPIFFPNGRYLFSATLTAQSILGENRQKTILSYTGTGSAIGVVTAGSRSYARRVENLQLVGTGTGNGVELDCVASSTFQHFDVADFTHGIWLRDTSVAGGIGYSLYNTFIAVSVSNCSTGYRISDRSNEAHFFSCRATGNYGYGGFNIESGNHTVITACAIEGNSNGVRIYDANDGTNQTRGTVLAFNRFEGNTDTDWTIFTGTRSTNLIANRRVNPATVTVDNGTGTMQLDSDGWIRAASVSTANRPTGMPAGSQVYDTTLSKPIWWNGSAWKDASGTTV